MAQCRRCNREIEFRRSYKGKWIAVDPEPLEFNDAPKGRLFVSLADGDTHRGGENVTWNPTGFLAHECDE